MEHLPVAAVKWITLCKLCSVSHLSMQFNPLLDSVNVTSSSGSNPVSSPQTTNIGTSQSSQSPSSKAAIIGEYDGSISIAPIEGYS